MPTRKYVTVHMIINPPSILQRVADCGLHYELWLWPAHEFQCNFGVCKVLTMNKVCAIFIFLVFFGVTLSERATSNGRAKHLFVQRDKPLRGSSLPSEIYLSSNDNETGKELRKESSLHRSRRSLRSSTNPTHTVVCLIQSSFMFSSLFYQTFTQTSMNVNVIE